MMAPSPIANTRIKPDLITTTIIISVTNNEFIIGIAFVSLEEILNLARI